MRISKVQKSALFYLYVIEQQRGIKPLVSVDLLALVNRSLNSEVASSNFRASCHTLRAHGLLTLYRTRSLTMAWLLTDSGREKAKSIYQEMTVKHEGV